MNSREIGAELERNCGLPFPSLDAPDYRELLAQYEVASGILISLRNAAGDPDQAKREAIEWMLQNHALPLNELAPHLERAMMRKLLPAEIESGTLYD